MQQENKVKPVLRYLPLLIVLAVRIIGFFSGIIRYVSSGMNGGTYSFWEYLGMSLSNSFHPMSLLFNILLFVVPVAWLIASGRPNAQTFLRALGVLSVILFLANIGVAIWFGSAYSTMMQTGVVPNNYTTILSIASFFSNSGIVIAVINGLYLSVFLSGVELLNKLFLAYLSFKYSKTSI